MSIAETTLPFIQSPLGVTLVGVACVTMVTLAGAAVRIVIQLARVEANIAAMHSDITTIKSDPDIMRWSNYGRMSQATQMMQHETGKVG